MMETENAEAMVLLRESVEGVKLRMVANMAHIIPGGERLAHEMMSLSHRVDYLASLPERLKGSEMKVSELTDEVSNLRQLEAGEVEKLKVLVDKMRRNGSSMNLHNDHRQLLHDFLNHLTVIDQDGKASYDDTNKLVHPKK